MADFVRKIYVHGYQWRPLLPRENEDAHLTHKDDWPVREYRPLDEFTGLFRTFAETQPTLEGILAFANKYGQLGYGIGRDAGGELDGSWENRSEAEWEEIETASQSIDNMESFFGWVDEINRMRNCVELWDRVQERQGDEHVMQKIQRTVSRQLRGRVDVILQKERKLGGMILAIVPYNLVGALWLQFAQTIGGTKQHRACSECGHWFEISQERFRKSRYYCSEACRSRAYRHRQERARHLSSEGKTPKEIALALESEVRTVKGWLKQGKEQDSGAGTVSKKQKARSASQDGHG